METQPGIGVVRTVETDARDAAALERERDGYRRRAEATSDEAERARMQERIAEVDAQLKRVRPAAQDRLRRDGAQTRAA